MSLLRSSLIALALISTASRAEAAPAYGPPAPEALDPDWKYPDRFSLNPDETQAEARARVDRKRRNATRWEIAYQILNVADTAQTLDCVSRNVCTEGNPLIRLVAGKRPSTGALIGIKAGTGLIHWLVFARKREHDPDGARRFAQWSVVVQGGVVAANARFTF